MDIGFDNVRVERRGRTILDIPFLRLDGKRTAAILGPNGAGKSTFLRLIAGLERPRRGDLRVGGARPVPGQDVAYAFQEQVFLRRSVRENLELGLRLRGVSGAPMRERVEAAMALLEIAHLGDRRADRLSGGEQRRVNLARTLCLRSPLVLLDEPLAGLDDNTYSRLLDDLPSLLAAFDATTLMVTPNRHEALRLADYLVVLVNGQVLASGEKRDVASNPGTRAVAETLGYSVLRAGDRHIAVPPEALAPGRGQVEFTLVVDGVADLVNAKEIVGRIGESRVRVRCPPEHPGPRPGEEVVVSARSSFGLSE